MTGILRNLNQSVGGKRILGTPYAGKPKSAIPAHSSSYQDGLLLNKIAAGDAADTLYKVFVSQPAQTGASLLVQENGAFQITAAQDGTYTGSETVWKYSKTAGITSATGSYSIVVGAGSSGSTPPPATIDISQISPAHIAVFGGSGSRIAVFGGTGARTTINGMTMKLPTVVAGKMMCDRDPDEISWYGADITQELSDRATTSVTDLSKILLDLVGVTALQGPLIQTASVLGVTRTYVVVLLGGVEGAVPPDWHWTARVACANGERFDKTTYFNRVDT